MFPEDFALARIARTAAAVFALAASQARGAGEGGTPAFGGSVRSVAAAADNYDFPLFFGPDNRLDGTAQSVVRLTAAGRRAEWFAYEIHAVESVNLSTFEGAGSGFFSPAAAGMRYRAFRDYWDQRATGDVSMGFWLDRCNAMVSVGKLDLTLGRQAVTFGHAYFWNPLDVFMAFDPRQFDREYKAGVDGLRADFALGPFSGVNLVAVAGRKQDQSGRYGGTRTLDADWEGSAVLGRLFGTASGWDLALQGGKVFGGYQAGCGWAGEIGPVGVRGEVAGFTAMRGVAYATLSGVPVELEDSVLAVAGAGRRFDSSLDIEAEYLYNGAAPAGLEAAATLVESGDSFQMGRHLAGLTASYEFMPLLTGRLTGVYSFSDGSAFVGPGFVYSAGNEAEFLAGASLNFGERPGRPRTGRSCWRASSARTPTTITRSTSSTSDFPVLPPDFSDRDLDLSALLDLCDSAVANPENAVGDVDHL